MKKTRQTQDEDLTTDDEAVRVTAMTSGAEKCGRWTMRPTAATEVSWMQRNRILESAMDILWRASAFAFIHSTPKPEVRAVVNSPESFIEAVDEWMDENDPTAEEIKELSRLLNERISEWFSSASDSDSPGSPGN